MQLCLGLHARYNQQTQASLSLRRGETATDQARALLCFWIRLCVQAFLSTNMVSFFNWVASVVSCSDFCFDLYVRSQLSSPYCYNPKAVLLSGSLEVLLLRAVAGLVRSQLVFLATPTRGFAGYSPRIWLRSKGRSRFRDGASNYLHAVVPPYKPALGQGIWLAYVDAHVYAHAHARLPRLAQLALVRRRSCKAGAYPSPGRSKWGATAQWSPWYSTN